MDGPVTAIIVDDEIKAIKILAQLIGDLEQVEVVATARDVDEAVDLILELRPDIIFLDIQMPIKNGFELLHEIRNYDVQPAVIFVTAYDEYAIEAIRHSAFDYLTKPVDPKLLKKAVMRYLVMRPKLDARKNIEVVLEKLQRRKLSFNTRTSTIFIDPEEITHITANGNYSEIRLLKDETVVVTLNLLKVIAMLPSGMFFRVNRSTLINVNYLSRIDRRKRICELEARGHFISFDMSLAQMRALENRGS